MDSNDPTLEPKEKVQKNYEADDAVNIKLEQMDPSYEGNSCDSIQFEEVKMKNWVECGSSPFRDELGIKLETDKDHDVLDRIKDEYNTEQSDEHSLRADADGELKMEKEAAVGCEEEKLETQKDSTKSEEMDAPELTGELDIKLDGTSNAEGAVNKKHGEKRRRIGHNEAEGELTINYDCDCTTRSEKILKIHISDVQKALDKQKESHPSNVYVCGQCNKKFKSKSIRDEHIVRKHPSSIASITSKMNECANRSYKTTSKAYLLNKDECRCIIDQLLEKSFSLYTFEEKKKIIETGRPTPVLNMKKESKNAVRYFKSSWYDENSWLCGCEKNKLYCWPCLLFSTEKNMWTSSGINDLNSFRVLKRRHEIAPLHVRCVANLIQFGKTRIESCRNQAFKESIAKYNENVKKNRYIVSTLIDAVCYLAKQEIPFRGHFEGDDSDNKGNYRELLTLIAKKDEKFQQLLETSTVFAGDSSDIQDDVIEAISTFMMNEIKAEIADASFISVIMDDSTDVSNESQLSVSFRYVCPDGDVCERFLKFVNVSEDRSVGTLSECLFSVLNEFQCGNKLIAQSYDGAVVMSGQHNGLQKLIRDKYNEAMFVHCYAHRLSLVFQQSVEHIKECKNFFQTLSGLAAFFSKSAKRASALDKLVQKRLPTVATTRWIYAGRLVEVVSSIRSELLELFKEMQIDTVAWDGETRICSKGFYITLQELDFNFFLNLFELILPKSEILFDILQNKIHDIGFCTRKVNEFLELLQSERNNFDTLWSKQQNFINGDVPNKRQRITTSTSYRRLYLEIFDTMTTQLTNRFSDLKHLEFLALYDFDNFKNYVKKFPDGAFNKLVKLYGQEFDTVKLKSELTVLYDSPDYSQKNLQEFYQYLKSSQLDKAFPEAFKLANLLLTLPATSASVERSCSATKRIKTCQRNAQLQDRMTSLSLISIEKNFLNGLMKKSSFYDSVIDILANKVNCRIDLKYKE